MSPAVIEVCNKQQKNSLKACHDKVEVQRIGLTLEPKLVEFLHNTPVRGFAPDPDAVVASETKLPLFYRCCRVRRISPALSIY